MPEPLTSSEVNSHTDPSVAKQYDNSAPLDTQLSDLYAITDKLSTCLLGTVRPQIGPVHRSMALAKRSGPDFSFLANKHSQKFKDLEHSSEVSITFQNSSTQDWVSIAGTATHVDNNDPRIKDLYKPGVNAWFGDLGDGTHTGGPEDPRMAVIDVKAKYITYWKSEVSMLGYAKEVGQAALTGKVANTGVLRELKTGELEKARQSQ